MYSDHLREGTVPGTSLPAPWVIKLPSGDPLPEYFVPGSWVGLMRDQGGHRLPLLRDATAPGR